MWSADYLGQIVDAARARGLHVERVNGNSTSVKGPALPAWTFQILLPDGILEWWISLFRNATGEEAHRDWCDHYETQGRSEDLEAEFRDSVLGVIDAVHGRELRLVRTGGINLFGRALFSRQILEVRSAGEDSWRDVWEFA